MGLHDGPAARRLSVQRRHKLLERLVGGHVPAAIPVLAPRVGDRAAFEAPLQPPQLVMGNMLEQPEEDLGARRHRNGGLGEWQAHKRSRVRQRLASWYAY
jgi:hypothetical protein